MASKVGPRTYPIRARKVYRDDQRFPGPEADRAFVEEMARKYRGQHFDAILAFGRSTLD